AVIAIYRLAISEAQRPQVTKRGASVAPFCVFGVSRYAGREVSSREVSRMARNGDLGSNVPITERILAVGARLKCHPCASLK
ncbi:MAG TPA: hypothetical protein VJ251_00240, partial [Stellaceae bacterium]|nr:hypothetical protein [Stellaceae bacterium]